MASSEVAGRVYLDAKVGPPVLIPQQTHEPFGIHVFSLNDMMRSSPIETSPTHSKATAVVCVEDNKLEMQVGKESESKIETVLEGSKKPSWHHFHSTRQAFQTPGRAWGKGVIYIDINLCPSPPQ